MDKPEFDAIIVCSTLNQMVNYLTILEHFDGVKGKVPVLNVTFSERYSKFRNQKWDKYLKDLLSKEMNFYFKNLIEFGENEIQNHNIIIEKLKIINDSTYKNKKLLWNITGGQRHLVMAIIEFVNNPQNGRVKDKIVFYEGNYCKLFYYSPRNKDTSKHEKDPKSLSDISFERLNLNIALKLMGFEKYKNSKKTDTYYYLTATGLDDYARKLEKSKEDVKKQWEEYEREKEFYCKFFKKFTNDNDCKILDLLVRTNKNNKDKEKLFLEGAIAELKSLPSLSKEFEGSGAEIFRNSLKNRAKTILFGYILEYMVFYKIIDVIKKDKDLLSNVADIHLSASSKLTGNERSIGTNKKLGEVDEFDIAILTKSGKVIIFECKSGGYAGDHMKSHHYSTYSVAGVYGTPILITPLMSIPYNNSKNKNIERYNNLVQYAQKARIEFWYLDEIETNIEKILKK